MTKDRSDIVINMLNIDLSTILSRKEQLVVEMKLGLNHYTKHTNLAIAWIIGAKHKSYPNEPYMAHEKNAHAIFNRSLIKIIKSMDLSQRIAIACDADLKTNTAIGRKIATELTLADVCLGETICT